MWSSSKIAAIADVSADTLHSTSIPRPVLDNFTLKETTDTSSKMAAESSLSLVDPVWELLDPSPDVRALFSQFNVTFFNGALDAVEVRWSPRMTLCAGLCCYEGHGGLCSIRLSEPLLKLRPRRDLIETLLHEMIHAFLFVTQNDRVSDFLPMCSLFSEDREAHGPNFQHHMKRINADAGTRITIYHTFHDEVANYQTHWWRCTGQCRDRPPFYGFVRRAMNRAPGPNDVWWAQHRATCFGTFVKVKEPEKSKKSSGRNRLDSRKSEAIVLNDEKRPDIRKFMQRLNHTIHDVQDTTLKQTPLHSTSNGPAGYSWPADESGHVLGGEHSRQQNRLLSPSTSELGPVEISSEVTAPSYSVSPCFEGSSITCPSTVRCPVCTLLIPGASINEHLDCCLSFT
ncbi:hypothetical protein EG68_09128 [Paragonimus skrjabini miyazakii]|uniref:Protein with SprT-like domain at the N terminus n=1 Tax=Paragonimus skrjabini miyazakii TaxID=59628 RepID=A0A8S9YGE1_9TREM|nr:hypothetical protein EG68_09128 [Paragonimus skrjabini miyazakii]